MKLLFNEAKATQAATQFLRLRGGRISYIKLIKLLYLADREALIRWGRPITTDCYVSMDVGPVVSRIYDLIRNEPSPNSVKIWSKFISDPEDYEVRLLGDPGSGKSTLLRFLALAGRMVPLQKRYQVPQDTRLPAFPPSVLLLFCPSVLPLLDFATLRHSRTKA